MIMFTTDYPDLHRDAQIEVYPLQGIIPGQICALQYWICFAEFGSRKHHFCLSFRAHETSP